MRMVDVGESVVLRSPNGERHHLEVDNDGTLATTTGTVYNETLVISAGGLSTGTPVTLPNGGSYLGEELEVSLNSSPLDIGVDYQYIGSGIKTQIEFTFDLVENDEINFKKIV